MSSFSLKGTRQRGKKLGQIIGNALNNKLYYIEKITLKYKNFYIFNMSKK